MGWQEQNEEQWLKIAFILQGETSSGIIWITCDHYQHRQELLRQFHSRFPNYQHTIGRVDTFSGGSLPAYFQEIFQNSGGATITDKPQLFHVSGLERYLSFSSGEGKKGFFEALNFERPLFYQGLPFVLVFWTDSHTLIQTHRLAADFWEWLSNRFHFEGPMDEIVLDFQENQRLDQLPMEMPSPAEQELLQNRNARLLAQLEEATKPSDRVSLWIGLADNCFKLRDFEASIRYRQWVLEHLPEQDSARRLDQFQALAKTFIFSGDRLMLVGEIGRAREQYMTVVSALPEKGLEHAKANALRCLGDLERHLGHVDSSRGLYLKAIDHFKTEHSTLGLANALRSLGDLESHLGNVDSARGLYDEAIGHFKTERQHLGLANALQSLGDLESRLGQLESSRELYEAAIGYYQTERDDRGLANAKMGIGILDFQEDNTQSAFQLLIEAAQMFEKVQDPLGLAQSLALVALILHVSGQPETRDQAYAEARTAALVSHTPGVIAYVENIGKKWLE